MLPSLLAQMAPASLQPARQLVGTIPPLSFWDEDPRAGSAQSRGAPGSLACCLGEQQWGYFGQDVCLGSAAPSISSPQSTDYCSRMDLLN